MITRRARRAGLSLTTCCHTFRATGITTYLKNGGTIEHAQQIANHESPRTTKLYDRTNDAISVDEIERVLPGQEALMKKHYPRGSLQDTEQRTISVPPLGNQVTRTCALTEALRRLNLLFAIHFWIFRQSLYGPRLNLTVEVHPSRQGAHT